MSVQRFPCPSFTERKWQCTILPKVYGLFNLSKFKKKKRHAGFGKTLVTHPEEGWWIYRTKDVEYGHDRGGWQGQDVMEEDDDAPCE